MVSIELLLDPDTEASVRADWDGLAAAGLSSLAAHRSASNRPHVTLLVRTALEAVSFTEAADLLPLPILLGAPIVFRHGDRAVLARQVIPSEQLLRLHRVVHSAAPAGEDAAHTVPGEWTPHVTLARRLPLARLSDALLLLGPAHRGTGVALRRWDSASATVSYLS
ncbi:2'-5' RNA ligase family protein [Microbacterium sp.]|uniref:2'-5' RNA ligase family protein n=1 Tax=Microbacterium sp. TaxID=51671 RepID=UPI002E31961B|nr:2'-5' RNA ligase family protein [Microbacterium sp.]HEX5728098.1 2'-5' RNA ligase family protein [Microbacterium sp.]